jgi:sterol desaturase/sphingolipid hydroxylase (fatty acid hydroxylase superfamily)
MADVVLNEWAFPNWSVKFIPIFCAGIMLGLEILSIVVPMLFSSAKPIPIKGKHLDELSMLDKTFVLINKLLTIVFVYHLSYVCYYTPTIYWDLKDITFANTIGSLVAFYLFYDFFYFTFHRILHFRWLYPWIHKHHHRQKAPSRGNVDAINVHPIEFLVGEYLHLITIYLIPCHMVAVVFFILAGGILASLNHTRYDVVIPPGVYSVKVHDVHHRLPESNYAQYHMFWDHLFGTYRDYDGEEAQKAR